MIEPIQDYFTVAIERRYEDTKTKSGIILLNTAWLDDTDMDRFAHKRIYGTVLGVPSCFSQTPYRAVDDGMPNYRKFIGHDDIVDRINRGHRSHAEKSYYPSTFDAYEVVTVADIAKRVNVSVGDKVYFTPQVTEPENFLGKENDHEIYRISVTEIFCVVGEMVIADKEFYNLPKKSPLIIMQGEWVLVKPNMETWEEITTKSGIIMKPHPDKKWLEGFVAHSSHDHLKPGMHIAYLPNADAEVTVEGEKYFLMPAQDIMGKFN